MFHSSRTKRAIPILLGALLATTVPSLAYGQTSSSDGPHIETVGTAERRVAPDRVTVHLQITTRARAASDAASENARIVAAVSDTLRKLGWGDAFATASYNVGPDYEAPQPREAAEGPRRIGYFANTVLRVRLTQLDRTGPLIDAALARGATGVEGVFFESSSAERARRDALADAATAARADAEALARAMGGTLGPLLSSSTAGSDDPRRMNVMLRGMGAAMGSTQITPNEIVITAGVVARWRFIPR
jgi:uncharacterized protein